ncbi:unnamed protein product [Ranitomeya imitator]|uniref:Uncharacterized protein n=1 Tax=Ranitomeya imitator TaxID=111125 RepID=A0ABN9M8I1_9NEOB|nr:unnamed protein product [Ranitomeya imitator]
MRGRKKSGPSAAKNVTFNVFCSRRSATTRRNRRKTVATCVNTSQCVGPDPTKEKMKTVGKEEERNIVDNKKREKREKQIISRETDGDKEQRSSLIVNISDKGPFTFSDAAAIPTTIRIAAASLFGRWRAVTQTALQRPTMPRCALLLCSPPVLSGSRKAERCDVTALLSGSQPVQEESRAQRWRTDSCRLIKLKEWFSSSPYSGKTPMSELNLQNLALKKKSSFTPSENSPAIDAFISAVNNDIEKLRDECSKEFKYPNMTRGEVRALQDLMEDDKIIIKKADKGGAVVLLNKNDYVDEIKRQLADPGVYERLTCDPKFAIAREIKTVMDSALDNKIIDQDLYDFLIVKFPVTPVLYTLPKIHKSLEHPPGRPIVSGCNSILSNIGILLDKVLNPIASNAESFIRDTADFLEKVNGIEIVGEVLLASFDVTSLYTSIDHGRGLDAIRRKLVSTQYSAETREFILQLLHSNIVSKAEKRHLSIQFSLYSIIINPQIYVLLQNLIIV